MADEQFPAPFSRQIIDCLRVELRDAPWVHDPFTGTGERLGALCDELGVPFTGTELEQCFINRKHVVCGDARDPGHYPLPGLPFWIATSPAYPNGVADHFKPGDTSRRYTYRAAAIELSGDPDYALDRYNMGRHSYRQGKKAELRYWEIAEDVVANWRRAERVILNVKDFYIDEKLAGFPREWMDLMEVEGWDLKWCHEIPVPGIRHGENRELRVDHELVLVYGKKVP